MSIRSQIAEHVKSGLLTAYRSPRSRRRPQRELYLTEAALRDLNDPQSAINLLVGRGPVVAALDRWSLKGRVWARTKRDHRIGGYILRLAQPPPEIWEIRVVEPRPQVRAFGRFAYADAIVVTRFHTRNMLGAKGSANWTSAMRECERSWSTLFPNDSPFTGTTIHDYVTEECDDFELNCPARSRRRR
jgi:hypothetical protein